MGKAVIIDRTLLKEIIKYEIREAINKDREQTIKDTITQVLKDLPDDTSEKFLIKKVQDTIRQTLSNARREKILQEIKDKKYVTQTRALKYLEDMGIGRRRLHKMIEAGLIRVVAKDESEPRKGARRIYSEDIYKILIDQTA